MIVAHLYQGLSPKNEMGLNFPAFLNWRERQSDQVPL